MRRLFSDSYIGILSETYGLNLKSNRVGEMDEMEKIRKMRCFVFRMLKYKEIILGNFMQNEV